jgi:hypothetical protein
MLKIVQKAEHYLARTFKSQLHLRYSGLSKRAGLKQNQLILSFDCDTPEDAEASKTIVSYLLKKGHPAVFAVPGKRIEAHLETYKSIANSGFEFINHGYEEHTAFDMIKGHYYSTTWYHEMTNDEVATDIFRAHKTLTENLEVKPTGFRAPHFGYFQKSKELGFLYQTLKALNYAYTSTTMPRVGLRKGPLFETKEGLKEFPVTGTFDFPLSILDSWQFISSPSATTETQQMYFAQFKKWVDFFANHSPGLLNFYVDPAHVEKFAGYFQAIEYAVAHGFKITTYTDYLSSNS